MDSLTNSILLRLRAKHLRMIEILGRVESMRAAANEMNTSQPAVTKLLRDVEDMLGVTLFERSSTGITPTPIGYAVVEFSRKVVSDVERFAGLVTNLKLGGYGNLKIGTIMASMPDYVPMALKQLKASRPLMTIHLVAAPSNQLLVELNNRTINLAIARLTAPEQSAQFNFEPLVEEEIWIFASADHRLAQKQHIDLEELFDEPWILQSPGTPLRLLLQRSFAEIGASALPNWIETNSVYSTLTIVRKAGMIAALPRAVVEEGVRAGDFVRLPVKLSYQLDRYGIVTLKDEVQTENTRFFIEVLRRAARDMRLGLNDVETTAP